MPWNDSTTVLSTNESVEIDNQDALRISGFQPFLTFTDQKSSMKARIQSADGGLAFLPQGSLAAAEPSVLFNNLPAPSGSQSTSAIEIHAQDAMTIVGFQPFLTLTDSNKGFAKSRIQGANGDLAFYPDSFIAPQSPAVVISNGSGDVAMHADVSIAGTLTAGGITSQSVVASSVGSDGIQGKNGSGSGITLAVPLAAGIRGDSDNGYGIVGTSHTSVGVHAESNGNASALEAVNRGAGPAGSFQGNVVVSGQLTAHDVILSGADCAEEFDVASGTPVEPGTVMSLDDHGRLVVSNQAYDTRVAGVISGAGAFRPALTLDRRAGPELRAPIALLGKTYCKVDASDNSISVGDLLTTSHLAGHAMRVTEASSGAGAIIGKAMASLKEGTGLIPILIALQ
jgi:hypothetical protein